MKPLVLLGLLLAACSHGESQAGPGALPPLQLLPVIPELVALRDAGPAAPDQRRLEQLLDLGRTAFESGGDARLAEQARRALLAEEGASWALEELLTSSEPTVRARAAVALGELGPQASLVPLFLRLKYEKDPMVRTWMAAALAQFGSGGGFPDLIAGMGNGETAQDAGLQTIAILKRAGREPGEKPTYQQLQDQLIGLEREWLDRGLLPPAKTDPVPDALTTARISARLLLLTGRDLRLVDETRYMLARMGRLGLPLLRRAVLAEDEVPGQRGLLRSHALDILRQLGPAAADLAPVVLPLLGEVHRGGRVEAAAALAAMRATSVAPFLRPWLADPIIEMRMAAAGALGPIGDQASEPRLRALMNDAKEAMDVRVQAAFSVALFERDRPGLRFLRERLQAKDYHEPTVRELIDRAESWR